MWDPILITSTCGECEVITATRNEETKGNSSMENGCGMCCKEEKKRKVQLKMVNLPMDAHALAPGILVGSKRKLVLAKPEKLRLRERTFVGLERRMWIVPLSVAEGDNDKEEGEEFLGGVRTTNGSCMWIENHLSGSDVCNDA